jgi:hypothetical protein
MTIGKRIKLFQYIYKIYIKVDKILNWHYLYGDTIKCVYCSPLRQEWQFILVKVQFRNCCSIVYTCLD